MTLETLNTQLKFETGQDSLSTADSLRIFNLAGNDYSYIALTASGRWKFDDTTHENASGDKTLPVASATLEADEAFVPLNTEFLMINQVRIKVDSNWNVLHPIDERDNKDHVLKTVYKTNGVPKFYDYNAHGIYVYPKSSTSRSMEVEYSRAMNEYTSLSDTVGIPSVHFPYLIKKASSYIGHRLSDTDYARIERDLQKWEGVDGQSGGKIRDWYSKRDQDTPRQLKGITPNVFMGSSRPRRR